MSQPRRTPQPQPQPTCAEPDPASDRPGPAARAYTAEGVGERYQAWDAFPVEEASPEDGADAAKSREEGVFCTTTEKGTAVAGVGAGACDMAFLGRIRVVDEKGQVRPFQPIERRAPADDERAVALLDTEAQAERAELNLSARARGTSN